MARIHKVTVTSGTLNVGDKVTAEVDAPLRDATRRNHTGTHLLHSALRQVLGPHVKQAGSLVAPDRLRFDFVHFSAVSAEDLRRIEDIVNQAILKNEPVTTAVRDTQEAIAGGAMALFGEKYGDKVRVVSVGDGRFSTELCGGTHVRATGDIGPFLITEEAGVAAGVRRIEALTGLGALDYARPRLHEFERVRAVLNAGTDDVVAKLEARLQTLEKAIKDRDRKLAKAAAGDSGGQGRARDHRRRHPGLPARGRCEQGLAPLHCRPDQVDAHVRRGLPRRAHRRRQGGNGGQRDRKCKRASQSGTAREGTCANRGRRRWRTARFRGGWWQRSCTARCDARRGARSRATTAGGLTTGR